MPGHPSFPKNLEKIMTSNIGKKGEWKRKSDSELEYIKLKLRKSSFSPVMPVATFIISCFIFIFVFHIQTSGRFIKIVCSAFSVSSGVYIIQIIRGRSLVSKSSVKICNKCFKEDVIGLKKCTCGGDFEPSEFYDFIQN